MDPAGVQELLLQPRERFDLPGRMLQRVGKGRKRKGNPDHPAQRMVVLVKVLSRACEAVGSCNIPSPDPQPLNEGLVPGVA